MLALLFKHVAIIVGCLRSLGVIKHAYLMKNTLFLLKKVVCVGGD